MHDLLLTRPAAASDRVVAELRAMGCIPARVVVSPLLDIVRLPLTQTLPKGGGVIFTSEAGVDAFGAGGRGAPAWVVGARTGAAAARAGFDVRLVAQTADDLVAQFDGTGPVVHLHGRHTRGDIAGRLAARGVTGCTIYDQVAAPLVPEARALLAGQGTVVIPLYSPRTADLLVRAVPAGASACLLVCALSDAVALAARPLGGRCCTAAAPTGRAMLDLVAKCLATTGSG
jgi:uroporphyrinogen-III synthase